MTCYLWFCCCFWKFLFPFVFQFTKFLLTHLQAQSLFLLLCSTYGWTCQRDSVLFIPVLSFLAFSFGFLEFPSLCFHQPFISVFIFLPLSILAYNHVWFKFPYSSKTCVISDLHACLIFSDSFFFLVFDVPYNILLESRHTVSFNRPCA